MNTNVLRVKKSLENLKEKLESECLKYNGYHNWYNMLGFFRDEMKNYVFMDRSSNISPKITKIGNGHIIDHHAIGYFAPLDFKRVGFHFEKKSPSEQIIALNTQLGQQGIRFIYVALPCKKAIYPEFIVPNIDLEINVIPQWRKMLLELVEHEVEVIDIYPEFHKGKHDTELYLKSNHHISPVGADVIAQKIYTYLSYTTEELPVSHEHEFLRTRIGILAGPNKLFDRPVVNPDDFCIANTVQIRENHDNDNIYIYTGMNNAVLNSEILMIGDCNVQAFLRYGASILANTSYYLNYPIRYGGRFLPFDSGIDCIEKIPAHVLKDKKILIYAGFPSASFVRAPNEADRWSTSLIPHSCFE